MHLFIIIFVSFVAIVAVFAAGVYYSTAVELELAAVKAFEQGEVVKIVSVVAKLKGFWAKITQIF